MKKDIKVILIGVSCLIVMWTKDVSVADSFIMGLLVIIYDAVPSDD